MSNLRLFTLHLELVAATVELATAEINDSRRSRLLFADNNVMLGIALRGRAVRGLAGQLAFSCLKYRWRAVQPCREANEFRFAIVVRVDTQVQFVKSSKTIGKMNMDQRGENRLSTLIEYSQFQGTWTCFPIDQIRTLITGRAV